MLYDWILVNKEFLKIAYALAICFICFVIVLKTDRMFKLSDYQGLRYFRNSFFFYGLGFFTRFILGDIPLFSEASIYFFNIKFFFEFFMVVAGFFLLYSLVWKNIEKEKSHNSLLNMKANIFYVVAFLVALLDSLFGISSFMYASQIILFLAMSVVGYRKLRDGDESSTFSKYYFFIIVLGLIAWVINALLEYVFDWNKLVQIGVYGINFLFFFFFLYAIIKIVGRKNG